MKNRDERGEESRWEEEEDEERQKTERRKWGEEEEIVILHSSGVCLAKGSSGRAEDYGIMVSVAGHVSRCGQHWPRLPPLSKEA